MEKIDKYIDKMSLSPNINDKIKYSRKLVENLILHNMNQKNKFENMTGGGIINKDISSLLDHIKAKLGQKTPYQTKNRYIVILYGPPNSGKGVARKIICNKLRHEFNETLDESNIFSTFIDTGVDDIIYQIQDDVNDKTIKEKLKMSFYDNLAKKGIVHDNDDEIKKYIVENINEIANNSYNEYSKNKKTGDAISEIMKFLTIFLGMNMFIETASWNKNYWNNFLSLVSYYNYMPVIVYPFTTNTNILFERNIDRGLQEFRFLALRGPYGIKRMATNMQITFKTMIQDVRNMFIMNNIYVYVYDTDIDKDFHDEIKQFNFRNISKIKNLYTIKTVIDGDIEFIDKMIHDKKNEI